MLRPKALRNMRNELDKLAAETGIKKNQNQWYKIRNQADTEDATEIFIYEEIGYWGITSDDFVRDLSNLSAKTISLRINSPGGSVWDAIAIHNALVQHSATVNVRVDALAASAASVIAMAGDTITMMPGSQMMIHDAIGVGIGNEAELKEYATWLGEQSNNIATMYAARATDLTAEEWRDKMLAETWLFAAEAVELGLADEVFDPKKDKKAPEKEEPEPEEEESESTEEEPEEEETEPTDRVHSLNNHGWKYNGRAKAPAPVSNSIFTDAELDAFFKKVSK